MDQAATHRPLRIALMDDHAIVRAGITALLEAMPGVEVVVEASNAARLLQALQGEAVDIALCDINVPGMDGIECLAQLATQHPQLRVIMLSMDDSAPAAHLACARGAAGYLVKHAATQELHTAIRTVAGGGRYLSPMIAQALQQGPDAPEEALTPRQLEVLRWVARGFSSRGIGEQLALSARTVEMHRARIMERLQLPDVAALTRYALRYRLVH